MPPQHSIQEWLAFAVIGVAAVATSLLPALPASADPQIAAFGTLLMYAAGIGLAFTSPTALSEVRKLERLLSGESRDA